MKNEEVETLFESVPLGTKVYIYNNTELPLFYAKMYHAIYEKTSSNSL